MTAIADCVTIGETDRIPRATEFPVEIFTMDGETHCQSFARRARPEIWIHSKVIFPDSDEGVERHAVIPISFGSIDIGELAAAILNDALARVNELREEPVPEDCPHVNRVSQRYGRYGQAPVLLCTACNQIEPWELPG